MSITDTEIADFMRTAEIEMHTRAEVANSETVIHSKQRESIYQLLDSQTDDERDDLLALAETQLQLTTNSIRLGFIPATSELMSHIATASVILEYHGRTDEAFNMKLVAHLAHEILVKLNAANPEAVVNPAKDTQKQRESREAV